MNRVCKLCGLLLLGRREKVLNRYVRLKCS